MTREEITTVMGQTLDAGMWQYMDALDRQKSRDLMERVLSAIEAAGIRIVPVEPVEAQIRPAVEKALGVSLSRGYHWPDYMRDLYGIMLAASPLAAPEVRDER